MLLTVSICTRNRSRMLRSTLTQLTRVLVPEAAEWEVLVVDNGSTDDTPDVLAEFVSLLPLRCISEAKLGLSHARNAAVSAAKGAYILWTDDDVLVDSQWLMAYFDAFRCHPDASVFGGPISPWFEGEPPSWLSRVFGTIDVAYAARHFDGGDAPLTGANLPFGANMAFRTDVLRDHQFDPELGRSGDGMISGEETSLIGALLASGHTGWWVSGACVEHFIPRDRQTTRYVRRWYNGHGRLVARLEAKDRVPGTVNRPRWVWRELVTSELAFLVSRLSRDPTVWIQHLKRASIARGQFMEFGALQRKRASRDTRAAVPLYQEVESTDGSRAEA